jgi:hypothetical protein
MVNLFASFKLVSGGGVNVVTSLCVFGSEYFFKEVGRFIFKQRRCQDKKNEQYCQGGQEGAKITV